MILIGSAVTYIDADGISHAALVTNIHHTKRFSNKTNDMDGEQELIDLVAVDPVSRQVVHYDRILEYIPCLDTRNDRFMESE